MSNCVSCGQSSPKFPLDPKTGICGKCWAKLNSTNVPIIDPLGMSWVYKDKPNPLPSAEHGVPYFQGPPKNLIHEMLYGVGNPSAKANEWANLPPLDDAAAFFGEGISYHMAWRSNCPSCRDGVSWHEERLPSTGRRHLIPRLCDHLFQEAQHAKIEE